MQNTGKKVIDKAKTLIRKETKAVTASTVAEEIIEVELEELDKDEVELFDDYLEFIMTFGYITLFAAAFPLGATLTSIFIYIETKSDTYKLEKLSRRPVSRKAHNIGVWELALDMFAVSAVFTNIILACFASD
jgi:anoctamin-10